jgi:hypothetical protein
MLSEFGRIGAGELGMYAHFVWCTPYSAAQESQAFSLAETDRGAKSIQAKYIRTAARHAGHFTAYFVHGTSTWRRAMPQGTIKAMFA